MADLEGTFDICCLGVSVSCDAFSLTFAPFCHVMDPAKDISVYIIYMTLGIFLMTLGIFFIQIRINQTGCGMCDFMIMSHVIDLAIDISVHVIYHDKENILLDVICEVSFYYEPSYQSSNRHFCVYHLYGHDNTHHFCVLLFGHMTQVQVLEHLCYGILYHDAPCQESHCEMTSQSLTGWPSITGLHTGIHKAHIMETQINRHFLAMTQLEGAL